MNAEYTLTEDDFLKLHLHGEQVIPALKWRSMMIRWVIPIGAIVYAVGFTAVIFKGPSSLTDKMDGLVFTAMALLLLIVSPKLHENLTRMSVRTLMRARKDSLLSEPVRVLLLPDELHITTTASHNGYKWSAIRNITEIPTHYFFWISARDAIIVPKRAFKTPDQQREFEQTFQRYGGSHSPSLPSQ